MAVTLGSVYVTPKLINLEFVNGDLDAGVLTVNHSLNSAIPIVIVLDNNYKQIIPDEITWVSAIQFTVDLSSFSTISGTWRLRILGY